MAADIRVDWAVDAASHTAFVERSGDRNPIHVDPDVARRTPFGRIVVHGMHLVLDAVDRAEAATGSRATRVSATFRHPVGVGDQLVTQIVFDGDRAQATVSVDVWVAAEIRMELHDEESATEPGTGLLALTRLIGMEVPGERSLFSSFDVEIGDPTQALAHRVAVDDARFSRMVLELSGSLTGTATAFVRVQPVEPSLGATHPEPDRFAGQRWLVVGGSRGLGALAVLLLDAGGADVRFTYRTGADDAARLASRTRAAAHHLDVELDTDLDLDRAEWQPTHLAYMASPPIFVGAAGVYSQQLFEQFRRVYVDAFLTLVDRLDALEGVVWPSSVAVETSPPGMAEYVDAKLAGERACRQLAAARPSLTVVTPRFPRLLTDQTTSFVPVEYGDGAAEVLAALRLAVNPSPGR